MRIPVRCRALPIVAAALAVWAQEPPPATPSPESTPPVLVYLNNKPMALPYRCTAGDVEWAGLSCSEDEPCPVYLEIAAAEGVGNRLFAAGNLHTSSVTLYSILLGSSDAGHTWREVHERIRGAGLEHLQFFDPATGWASGESLFPLPQDPFLLLTSDGGETWRSRPVLHETGYGAIQQFYFSSRSTGSAIIDRGAGSEGGRYALYESPDGGDTWSIKQESSAPITLKRGAPAPSDVRVRADGGTQSFQIERQSDGRWAPVAAFAVKAGVCKGD